MHSRKKGKSGSTRPVKKTKPAWLALKPKEVEMLVLKLAKEGKTSSEIGIMLRDSYGIPSVKAITNKSIAKIMKEKNVLSLKYAIEFENRDVSESAKIILEKLDRRKKIENLIAFYHNKLLRIHRDINKVILDHEKTEELKIRENKIRAKKNSALKRYNRLRIYPSDKWVGQKLGISKGTVSAYINKIKSKIKKNMVYEN